MDPISVTDIIAGWKAYGFTFVAGAVLTSAVWLYKKASRFLPPSLRWSSWSSWIRLCVVFLTSALGAGLTAHATGIDWAQAVGLGVNAGFVAVGLRESKMSLSRPLSLKTRV